MKIKMKMMTRSQIHWTLLMLTGITAISFSSIFIRWSSAPVSVLAMYRLLLTNLMMLPFIVRYRSGFRDIKWKEAVLLAGSGFFLALHFLLWMGSLRYTSVASSTAIMALEPIFVLLGSYLLHRETISRAAAAGMSAAVCGTVWLGWGDIGMSSRSPYGDILSLGGTAAVAVHMLLGKRLRQTVSSWLYSFIVFFTAGLAFAGYNLAQGIRMTGYPAKEWGLFLLLAVVPTVCGHLLFNWMLRYIRAASVSMSVLGEPVGAALLAFLLLGEPLTLRQGAAALCILAGVWVFIKEG